MNDSNYCFRVKVGHEQASEMCYKQLLLDITKGPCQTGFILPL